MAPKPGVQVKVTLFASATAAPSAGLGLYAVLGGIEKLQTEPFQGLSGFASLTSSMRQ